MADEQMVMETKKKRGGKIAILVAAIIVVLAGLAAAFIFVFWPMIQYSKADSLMEAGKYKEAYELYTELGDYKDSEALADEAHMAYEKEMMKAAKVGDTIFFGHYEQDNNQENGLEPIEWIVLERQGSKALVISKYCLTSMKYNNMYIPTTWEVSLLRGWLNTEFSVNAFTADERSMITITTNSTPDNLRDPNPEYHTIGGNDTKDRVFLLCGEEVEKYFPTQEERRAYATPYAKAAGVYVDSETSWWWTRTPGGYQHFSTIVRTNGYIQYTGGYLCSKNGGVRPAMWVDLGE